MINRTLVPFPATERRRLIKAGAVGAFMGWLAGRRHHPLFWAALVVSVLFVVGFVLSIWPYVLSAATLLAVAHARRHGHSWQRIGLRVAVLVGTAIVIAGVLVLAGIGPALLVGVAGFAAWRIFGHHEPRMTQREWFEHERREGFAARPRPGEHKIPLKDV
jgi:hypothetical protein